MARILDLTNGIHVSITNFSTEFGVTRETVSKRIIAAGLQPSGKRGGYPVYRLRDVHKAVYHAAADGAIDPDKLDPFQRKAHYQAEHEKINLEKERGQLLPRIEVEQGQARFTKIVTHCFDTLPDRIERDCGASPLILAKIEKCLDEVREELYESVTAEEPSDAHSAVL